MSHFSFQVPEDWDVVPIGRLLREVNERTPSGDERLLGLTKAHGVVDRKDIEQRAAVASSYEGYKLCRLGDLVLNRMQAWNGVLGVSTLEGMVSPDYAVFRPRPSADVSIHYVSYLLSTPLYISFFTRASKGIGAGFMRLYTDAFNRIPCLLPDRSEQYAIAAFLDRETAKINTLIEKKRRLLDLLDEERTALITRAVTRGLDADVAMKDSGVEWLGQIPAHWDATKTKFVAKLRTGHTPSRQRPEYWENTTIPWFGLADVWQIRDGISEYVRNTKENVSELGLAHSSAVKLPPGTVILSRTASVGFSAITATEMATTQDFVNWTPGDRLLAEYLLYVLRSMKQEFRRLTMGSTHQTIYMPDVAALSAPLPPLAEQQAIVDHIRKHTGAMDLLVKRTSHAIVLLEEYRTAVITAAVTGQVGVPATAA